MHKYLIFFFLLLSQTSYSQKEITWEDLEDIEFNEQYVEELDEYILFPQFGPSLRELDREEILLTGYVLAIDPEKGYYVLSKGPFASCFFCGSGGPETIAELSLKSNKESFYMDEFITIKGILKLNNDDIYRCVYIIEDSERTK